MVRSRPAAIVGAITAGFLFLGTAKFFPPAALKGQQVER